MPCPNAHSQQWGLGGEEVFWSAGSPVSLSPTPDTTDALHFHGSSFSFFSPCPADSSQMPCTALIYVSY